MHNILKWHLSLATVLLLAGLATMPSCKKSEPGGAAEKEGTSDELLQESESHADQARGEAQSERAEELIRRAEEEAAKTLDEALQKLQELEAQKKQAEEEIKKDLIQQTEKNLSPPVEKPTEDLVPLEIELPRPMFVGTPPNTKIDRVENPLGKPRPPLPVPEGTVNASKGKPVTSSDENPIIGDLDQITDGDKEGIDGNWVELMYGVQWVQIDLQDSYEIYAVVFWHFHMQPWVFRDVVVQVSEDADFINATTLFNNDYDNSSGLGAGEDLHYVETSEGKLVEGKGTRARYVRLYSNGNTENDSNQYIEVEVYGKPTK